MATLPSLVSLEDYLSTPELFERHEYVDGVLLSKPMGTWKHGTLQMWIGALLLRYYPSLNVAAEIHTRLRETEWRLPDIGVQSKDVAGGEKYGFEPLLLAIEILSPEDRLGATFAKCERYHDWGVPDCWIFDPEKNRAWSYPKQEEPREVFDSITAGEIALRLSEVFSVLA